MIRRPLRTAWTDALDAIEDLWWHITDAIDALRGRHPCRWRGDPCTTTVSRHELLCDQHQDADQHPEQPASKEIDA